MFQFRSVLLMSGGSLLGFCNMGLAPDIVETLARARADLRMGVPIVLEGDVPTVAFRRLAPGWKGLMLKIPCWMDNSAMESSLEKGSPHISL